MSIKKNINMLNEITKNIYSKSKYFSHRISFAMAADSLASSSSL